MSTKSVSCYFILIAFIFKIEASEEIPKRHLILSLSELNLDYSSVLNPPQKTCDLATNENDNVELDSNYYKNKIAEYLVLVLQLINNSEVDLRERKITQTEMNLLVNRFEKFKLRGQDIDKLIFSIGSNKDLTIRDRGYAIGVLSDIQSVKKKMEYYSNLDRVKCFFLYDDDMKKNLGPDSVFYNHEKLSDEDKKLFDPNSQELMVVGRCKGVGLLLLPEYKERY